MMTWQTVHVNAGETRWDVTLRWYQIVSKSYMYVHGWKERTLRSFSNTFLAMLKDKVPNT